jgi:hypothetical protein
MPAQKQITFTVEGSGISPQSLPIGELLPMLDNLIAATIATAKGDFPTISLKGLPMSLTDVRAGSATVVFEAGSVAHISVTNLIHALEGDEEYAQLVPQSARSRIEKIQQRVKAHNWRVSLGASDNGEWQTATIAPDTILFAEPVTKGNTTLLAYIVRVGGEFKRTATIKFSDNTHITARIATRELTEKLGEMLYDFVELHGEAQWYSRNWMLKSFKVTSIGTYRESTSRPQQALKDLGEASGGFWDSIDVEQYLRELRSE